MHLQLTSILKEDKEYLFIVNDIYLDFFIKKRREKSRKKGRMGKNKMQSRFSWSPLPLYILLFYTICFPHTLK